MMDTMDHSKFEDLHIAQIHKIYDYDGSVSMKQDSSYISKYEEVKQLIDGAILQYCKSDTSSIRELLYRMNSMDPIEREVCNRGFRVINSWDCPANYNMEWLNVGKDDTSINGLMNHEIDAVLTYLLAKIEKKIVFKFKPIQLTQFLMNYCKRAYNFIQNYRYYITRNQFNWDSEELNDFQAHYDCNLRYLMLQSSYDVSCSKLLNYAMDFNRKTLMDYIDEKALNLSVLGEVNGKPLCAEIFNLYSKLDDFGLDEVTYNLVRNPVIQLDTIVNSVLGSNRSKDNIKKNNLKILINRCQRYAFGEDIRRIFYTLKIVYKQLIMFNFIDYLKWRMEEDDLEYRITNPIDDRLWQDRDFQYTLIMAESYYDIVKQFKKFYTNNVKL